MTQDLFHLAPRSIKVTYAHDPDSGEGEYGQMTTLNSITKQGHIIRDVPNPIAFDRFIQNQLFIPIAHIGLDTKVWDSSMIRLKEVSFSYLKSTEKNIKLYELHEYNTPDSLQDSLESVNYKFAANNGIELALNFSLSATETELTKFLFSYYRKDLLPQWDKQLTAEAQQLNIFDQLKNVVPMRPKSQPLTAINPDDYTYDDADLNNSKGQPLTGSALSARKMKLVREGRATLINKQQNGG